MLAPPLIIHVESRVSEQIMKDNNVIDTKGQFSPGLTKDQGAVFHGCFGSGIHTT